MGASAAFVLLCYMTKHDHILYWRETAEEDWLTTQDLFNSGRYMQCLFWAHLVVEKLSKAHWVQDNVDDYPPRIHNIVRLWQNTTLQPTAVQEKVALDLNQFQLEGRYPDYSRTLQKQATKEYTQTFLRDITDLRTWLLSTLP